MPIADWSSGLVFFGFCLYPTNGLEVQSAIVEASRTLAEGGYVAIYDFDSPDEVETKYEHLEPLISYRRPYVSLMELHGFTLISKTPLSHSGGSDVARWDPDSMERTALWIFTR